MKKINEYKGIIIIALILVLGAFYWYELRPISIRKDCSKFFSNLENYQNCLHLYGLSK
jgi:hypothetical protein